MEGQSTLKAMEKKVSQVLRSGKKFEFPMMGFLQDLQLPHSHSEKEVHRASLKIRFSILYIRLEDVKILNIQGCHHTKI